MYWITCIFIADLSQHCFRFVLADIHMFNTRLRHTETPRLANPIIEKTRERHTLVVFRNILFIVRFVFLRLCVGTMDALLASEPQTKKNGDLRESLCYYLSIIFVLLAFIFSSVSLGLCSAVRVFQIFVDGIEYYSK